MAALGKIRSKGALLIGIIGLGLFAFIAEEAVRSCESNRNNQRQQIGEVLGEKIDVQSYQKLVDEYTDVIKMTQGRDNLTDQELSQVKDMVWNQFVQSSLISAEAKKLGLTVTDEELQNVLRQGTHQMLAQTPFVNQQTGRFDAEQLKQFLAQYKTIRQQNPQAAEQYTRLYNYWTFIEKSLREQLLAQKYQGLLSHCLISNPVSAKAAWQNQNSESTIQLVAFPYADIKDDAVKVDESDLKAKYAELKERFRQPEETRDIKYVEFQVKPSATDRAALLKTVNEQASELAAASDPTEVVRKSGSLISYLGLPVTKDAFPSDIAAKLDSMAVGQTTSVTENTADNTLNVIRLISKVQLPDSVQFRAIQVGGASADEAHKRADSIYTALKAGADFAALAKTYGQTGDQNWLTSAQYQNAPSIDKDTRAYLEALSQMNVGETRNIAMTSANIIVQVTDRRAMTSKYLAAVIKKTIDFSKDTYSAAYNKFSQFVSETQNADQLEKNAQKYGFKVQQRTDMRNTEHYVAGISATRDALKWIFEDAKEGNISPLYECGENDRLLVVAMTKVHPIGYRAIDDETLSSYIRGEVVKDKKAEQTIAKLKGVNSIAAAKQKGGKVSEVKQITFAAPAFLTGVGASEPALSGAVAAVKKGQFSKHPVKGNAGVYLFQVTDRQMRPGKFDAKATEQSLRQRAMQMASSFMQELYQKAKVVDNRYLFF